MFRSGDRIRHRLCAGVSLFTQGFEARHVTPRLFHRQGGPGRTGIDFTGVQFRQHLALFDTLPCIDRDRTDHSTDLEGEFRLPVRAHDTIDADCVRIRRRLCKYGLHGHTVIRFGHCLGLFSMMIDGESGRQHKHGDK